LKQLNSLALIDIFSCLDGVEVMHRTAVRDFSGLIPVFGTEFGGVVVVVVVVVILL